MTAGRLWFAARIRAAILGLLAVIALNGCALHKEYVRRGVVLDSLAVRTDRIEKGQSREIEARLELRADVLTEVEALASRLAQVEARLSDIDDRLSVIGRKLGVWRGAAVALDTPSTTVETLPVPLDTGQARALDQLYATAYLDFTRGKYDVAIAGFRRFIETFPESDLADNAQYWIAECQHSRGDLNEAEREFRLVLDEYPDGNKVPAAAYKLGLVYLAQDHKEKAKKQFQDVISKYPGTTEARLAQERISAEQE